VRPGQRTAGTAAAAGYEHEIPAAPAISAATDDNPPVSPQQPRLRRKASAHRKAAFQLFELMQGSSARFEELWRQLPGRLPAARRTPPRPAAAREREIQQTRTPDWHLREARRRRDEAARAHRPEDPAPR
jgi:hypothetical protein